LPHAWHCSARDSKFMNREIDHDDHESTPGPRADTSFSPHLTVPMTSTRGVRDRDAAEHGGLVGKCGPGL
jgi:hypothetical protein